MIKPHTLKELVWRYNVSRKALTSWMTPHKEEIGIKYGRYYNVKQVETIFRLFGNPPR